MGSSLILCIFHSKNLFSIEFVPYRTRKSFSLLNDYSILLVVEPERKPHKTRAETFWFKKFPDLPQKSGGRTCFCFFASLSDNSPLENWLNTEKTGITKQTQQNKFFELTSQKFLSRIKLPEIQTELSLARKTNKAR